jgi:2-phospho-L-lactate guanylyltransferase (CobY/MobA/RfbA family)
VSLIKGINVTQLGVFAFQRHRKEKMADFLQKPDRRGIAKVGLRSIVRAANKKKRIESIDNC